MSRRRAPSRRWHVGDRCRVPLSGRVGSRVVTFWERAEVVALRGDRVVVRRWQWESEHPWWDLRQPSRHVGRAWARAVNRFGHDRHRRTL